MYDFTYSGMLKSLKWFYEIKHNDKDSSNGRIGIIPYIYKDAYDYYYNLYLAQQRNKDIENSKCYNKNTYALFCNNKENHELNHAVSIIGWDDTFEADKFLEGARPKSDGAWIIKNSWGDQVGDKGYMYVSYEDVILSSELYGKTLLLVSHQCNLD